jgi:oxygen-independent coproporphyrinogen III oxidase
MDALGLYISVPFCRSKCSYCNFASGVHPESQHGAYVDRVLADLRRVIRGDAGLPVALPRRVDSVYLGGGTPSILAPGLLRRLFEALRSEFEITRDAEITLECAPGQIEDAFLDAMLECGVNRVSFGVQSFVDREAAVTGRLHTGDVALRDIRRVQTAGIANVNADLIAGLPHQDADSWRFSLETLAESGVNHASVYMLEVDEDSRLGRELLAGGGKYHASSVPDDDRIADLYLEAVEFLESRGLAQYEISNFARGEGARSRHNLKYWRRQPYLGLGLDAHSMSRSETGVACRFQTGDDLGRYLAGGDEFEVQTLTREQELEEAWFLGLRLNDGVSLRELREEFGAAAVAGYGDLIAELCGEGMVTQENDRVRLTTHGILLSNEVFSRFIREPEDKVGASVVDCSSPVQQKDLVTVTY